MICPPTKPKNKERRSREFLSSSEIDKLIKTARDIGRYGHRDATMILIAFRHGLRVSELVSLRWSQFDLKHGLFHVVRRKNSIDSTHPLAGVEMRALQKIRRENPGAQFVFLSERKAPMTDSAFRKMLYRTGEEAKPGLPIHPHMLRHSCGFKLANDGQDTRSIQYYLGHKNIQNTVPYTQISPSRFRDFWED
ncbi:MAG: tyrosine-type recombinase/integrase [Candidatus Brocadia sp.]|nr:tyrosine-type recombinase/integrase [Candidatus Brocadia sp.]